MMTEPNIQTPRPKLRYKGTLREIINTVVFIVAAFTLLQLAIPRSIVHGTSMQPSLHEGERLVISRVNYLFGEPHQGEIIVFNSPSPRTPDEAPLIKRVIGLPGDVVEIRDTLVYVNDVLLDETYINEPCRTNQCRDERWELGPDEFFVMGDNRNHSNDSRNFGPVPRENLIGEALFRFWPLQNVGSIHRYLFVE